MEFWEVIRVNLCSMAFEILFVICTIRILLGRIPDRGPKHAVMNVLQGFGLEVLLSVTGAVCYLGGFWKLGFGAGSVLWEYFVLAVWVLFVRALYGLPFKTCWMTILLTTILDSYGGLLSELFVSGKMFHLEILEERRAYLLWLLVTVPVCRLICLLLVYRIRDTYRQWVKREGQKKVILLTLGLYPVYARVLIWLVDYCKGIGEERLMITLSLLLLIHLVLVYVGREEQQRERILQQEVSLMQQSAYIEQMEQIQTEVRRFRHDLKNMMAGMYLQAREGELDALQALIGEMAEDFDRQAGIRIRLMSQLANVHVTEVKGLLLEKLAQMQREEIPCELEVLLPFESTRMRGIDLCRCLGILLDNAIEEVRGREDGCISVMVSSQEHGTTFRVKNTLYQDVDLRLLEREGYSTKGEGRGLGLSNYRKILGKYDFVFPAMAVREGCLIQEFKVQES